MEEGLMKKALRSVVAVSFVSFFYIANASASIINLADSSSFRVSYTVRAANGSGTGAGTAVSASAASGSVLVNTPTWTYENWNIQYPAISTSNSFTMPVGLGSAQFTLSFNVDPWGWQMPGPIVTTVTQPTLGHFETEGFSTDDIVMQNISGSWTLKGPTSQTGGTFSFIPVPETGEGLWSSVMFGPPVLAFDFFRSEEHPLFSGTLDGASFNVVFSQLEPHSNAMIGVPEPTTIVCAAIAIAALAICRGTRTPAAFAFADN
jgi:hypothetical protein